MKKTLWCCVVLSGALLLSLLVFADRVGAQALQCGDIVTMLTILTNDLTCSGPGPALTVQGTLDLNRKRILCQQGKGTGIRLLDGALLKNGVEHQWSTYAIRQV